MSNRVERVTIVGGGTSGWLTALILNAHLNIDSRQPRVAISLIESPDAPRIGVGEATIQNLKNTLNRVGLDESEFIRRCNASFKLAVRFVGWSGTIRNAPTDYYTPLNDPLVCGGLDPIYHFCKFGPHLLGGSFAESVFPNVTLIKAGRGPKRLGAPNYTWDINYAYHVDAALLAEQMRDFAVARGIEHLRDNVVDVLHDETGAIAALQLERLGRYSVELVVDCTGFKALIWGRMGAEPFRSFGDRLLNDRAVWAQIPHPDPTKIEPCTRASALGAGWVWRIPLFSRIGTGYVYCSAFRNDEEARAEFLEHLRATGDLPADGRDPETRVIKMRIGYTRQPWIKNCVAIGLSGGFVEPLESTGIYTIDAAAHQLVINFPDKQCSPEFANAFNSRAASLMEEIVDFLQVLFVTTNRTEPYWLAAREETRRSDWLKEKLALWRRRFPHPEDTYENRLFDFGLYTFSLYPRGYFAKIHPPLEGSIKLQDWNGFGQHLQAQVQQLLRMLPSHHDLLTSIRASPSLAPEALLNPLSVVMPR